MESPTYVTLGAQMALQKELEVVANNVANASTTGFKADRQLFQTYVDRLAGTGGSVDFMQDRSTYIDRDNGPLQSTGNPLDVALQGDGYLAVQGPGGTQYTRDGQMHTGSDGTLLDSGGRSVLGPDSQPIQLPEGYTDVEIKGDGTINAKVNDQFQQVGQIGMFRAANALAVTKAGDGLFVAPPGSMQPVDSDDTTTRMVQGSIEGSTVQPVKEIANMTQLSRAYEQLQNLISDDNDREQKMIDALGHQP